jgi:hypothetical protein
MDVTPAPPDYVPTAESFASAPVDPLSPYCQVKALEFLHLPGWCLATRTRFRVVGWSSRARASISKSWGLDGGRLFYI